MKLLITSRIFIFSTLLGLLAGSSVFAQKDPRCEKQRPTMEKRAHACQKIKDPGKRDACFQKNLNPYCEKCAYVCDEMKAKMDGGGEHPPHGEKPPEQGQPQGGQHGQNPGDGHQGSPPKGGKDCGKAMEDAGKHMQECLGHAKDMAGAQKCVEKAKRKMAPVCKHCQQECDDFGRKMEEEIAGKFGGQSHQ